ncbi:MAG: PD-(D/E)XK nuclease family protein [Steroidobacteraceae bacterium]
MLTDSLRRAIDAAEPVLVASPQRAAAVRLAHAREQVALGRAAWRSPAVHSVGAFLLSAAQRLRLAGAGLPRLLAAHEEPLLWGEAARELAGESSLLLPDALARSLQRAALLVGDADIAGARIAADPATESQWLHRAMAQVQERGRELDALPRHALLAVLQQQAVPPGHAAGWLAGVGTLPRAVARLLGRWGQDGAGFVALPPVQPARATPQLVETEDPGAELERAAAWCRELLERDAGPRLLLVVPDLAERRGKVQRALAAALEPGVVLDAGEVPASFAIEGGEPLATYPEPALALELLEMLTRSLPVGRVARLLERPGWGGAADVLRARSAGRLRARRSDELSAHGLAAILRDTADEPLVALAGRIVLAAQALEVPADAAPAWAARCSQALALLGWPAGEAPGSATQQVRARWGALLAEFASAARLLGRVASRRAIDVLGAMARQESFAPASGDVAVTVTDALDDPVVGYDGIWVCGLQAEAWPRAVRLDPLVPWYLQREAGLPAATADGCHALALAQLEAWRAASPELRLSWAASDGDDARLEPSPLLAPWPRAPRQARPRALAASLRAAAPPLIESIEDARGPTWPPARDLPRGTTSLERQNDCPFRAYAELRLGASAAETREPGIDRRERGTLLHAALQSVWRVLGSQQRLAATSREALEELVADCVQRAARELAPADDDLVGQRNWRREQQRTIGLALASLALDLQRAPFAIEETERDHPASLGGARLRLRIDRVDRLEDGRRALIDYKSGRRDTPDWFGARADRVQLFTYAAALATQGRQVAALGTTHLVPRRGGYEAVAAEDGLLPGARRVADWPQQLQRWQGQVERLAQDFLAGDARLDPADRACERCDLAIMCRRSERLGGADPEGAAPDGAEGGAHGQD